MKVRDLMTKTVASCRADTNLAAVGAAIWEHDCGVLLVIDESGKVTGIVTDRDICIALSTRGGRSSELTAGEVAISPVLTCEPDDDVYSALKTIREERIHRLPVVNRGGALEGILSTLCVRPENPTASTSPTSPMTRSPKPFSKFAHVTASAARWSPETGCTGWILRLLEEPDYSLQETLRREGHARS